MRETPKAAAAYAEYAAMGPMRSLAKLHQQLRQSQGTVRVGLDTLEAWSAAHHWQQRVRAHDAAIIAEQEARRLADNEQMNERHALLGKTHQMRAIDQIGRLMAEGRFGSQAAVMLLKLAIDVERTARDLPTTVERHEQTGAHGGAIQHEVTTANAAALDAQLDRIAARLAGAARAGGTAEPASR